LTIPQRQPATFPSAINDGGQIVGYHNDDQNVSHGFLYSGGIFTTLDAPGNFLDHEPYTFAYGINNAGDIVGEAVAGVPEPSTWALMLLGFAGLGFAFRQSRRKVSVT
jgi:probable HAF family extracellular repeat protein